MRLRLYPELGLSLRFSCDPFLPAPVVCDGPLPFVCYTHPACADSPAFALLAYGDFAQVDGSSRPVCADFRVLELPESAGTGAFVLPAVAAFYPVRVGWPASAPVDACLSLLAGAASAPPSQNCSCSESLQYGVQQRQVQMVDHERAVLRSGEECQMVLSVEVHVELRSAMSAEQALRIPQVGLSLCVADGRYY